MTKHRYRLLPRRHNSVVELHLEREGVDPNSSNNNGRAPLSFATEGGHEGVVRLLQETGWWNANLRHEWGYFIRRSNIPRLSSMTGFTRHSILYRSPLGQPLPLKYSSPDPSSPPLPISTPCSGSFFLFFLQTFTLLIFQVFAFMICH